MILANRDEEFAKSLACRAAAFSFGVNSFLIGGTSVLVESLIVGWLFDVGLCWKLAERFRFTFQDF